MVVEGPTPATRTSRGSWVLGPASALTVNAEGLRHVPSDVDAGPPVGHVPRSRIPRKRRRGGNVRRLGAAATRRRSHVAGRSDADPRIIYKANPRLGPRNDGRAAVLVLPRRRSGFWDPAGALAASRFTPSTRLASIDAPRRPRTCNYTWKLLWNIGPSASSCRPSRSRSSSSRRV